MTNLFINLRTFKSQPSLKGGNFWQARNDKTALVVDIGRARRGEQAPIDFAGVNTNNGLVDVPGWECEEDSDSSCGLRASFDKSGKPAPGLRPSGNLIRQTQNPFWDQGLHCCNSLLHGGG